MSFRWRTPRTCRNPLLSCETFLHLDRIEPRNGGPRPEAGRLAIRDVADHNRFQVTGARARHAPARALGITVDSSSPSGGGYRWMPMIFSVSSPSGRPAPWTGTACRGTSASDSAPKCGKDVFNLTAMKPYETVAVVSAIREPGEQRCVRVYQRPDGTLAATGCPTAPPGRKKPGSSRFVRSWRSSLAVQRSWGSRSGSRQICRSQRRRRPPILKSSWAVLRIELRTRPPSPVDCSRHSITVALPAVTSIFSASFSALPPSAGSIQRSYCPGATTMSLS